MTLKSKSINLNFNTLLSKNKIINGLFGNIIVVAILIVFIQVILIEYDINYFWGLISTIIILILHNKTIKLYYINKDIKHANNEFTGMMEDNITNILAQKNGSNGCNLGIKEPDIVNFLDTGLS